VAGAGLDDRAVARAADLGSAALAGDRLALARLLTAVENRSALAEAALRDLYPRAGHAHIVGITGPPGAGKSTLVAALIGHVRERGRSVAVVAVDPSSPITGGALLGDRVRMQAHASDRDVFIRSMAARGHAGGLSSSTSAAAAVLDACGFDLILVETVGTGQSEVEVASAADTTVVLESPEMGDEVQAIKAGLLEVADIVVVNKGDRPGAQRTASQLRAMLSAAPRIADGSRGDGPERGEAEAEARAGPEVGAAAVTSRARPKRPDVMITTASTGAGVAELLEALDRHRPAGGSSEREARRSRAEALVWAIVGDRLRDELLDGSRVERTTSTLDEVADHSLDPYAAADRLLASLRLGESRA
jgi:LAO/AO transport system kinase